jgi:hypothetical protein
MTYATERIRYFRAMRFEHGIRQITGATARILCRAWIQHEREKQ